MQLAYRIVMQLYAWCCVLLVPCRCRVVWYSVSSVVECDAAWSHNAIYAITMLGWCSCSYFPGSGGGSRSGVWSCIKTISCIIVMVVVDVGTNRARFVSISLVAEPVAPATRNQFKYDFFSFTLTWKCVSRHAGAHFSRLFN